MNRIATPDTPPRRFLSGTLTPLDFYVNLLNVKSDLHSSFNGVNWRRVNGRELESSIHSLRGVAAYCREIECAIRKKTAR